jgi:hypothetical protein
MIKETERYLSHLVRFQCVNAAGGPAWRVFVQQIGEREPLCFPDLEHYFEFVTQETKTAVLPPSTAQEKSK